MHGLDIIILRNAEAAGREQAHDDTDTGFVPVSDVSLASAIITALVKVSPIIAAYVDGYRKGLRDK